MIYNVDIVEAQTRNGELEATLREEPIKVVSRHPEYHICRAIWEYKLPDGSIQFWRDGKPTSGLSSAHAMGKLASEPPPWRGELKICVDCEHVRIGWKEDQYICFAVPGSEQDSVTGNWGGYSCRQARQSDICGPAAKLFKPRNHGASDAG